MRIARVTGWSIHLPYAEGSYRMAGDRVTTGMDAIIVRVVADDGTVGIGESGTVGVTFDAHHPATQVAGVKALASAVVGADARSPQSVHRRMTAAMTGHPHAKSPIDIAVWDMAARAAGVPLWKLLGGDGTESTPLYRPVQGATPADAVAKAHERLSQGYRRLQVKVGDDPIVDAQRVLAVRAAVGEEIVIFATIRARARNEWRWRIPRTAVRDAYRLRAPSRFLVGTDGDGRVHHLARRAA